MIIEDFSKRITKKMKSLNPDNTGTVKDMATGLVIIINGLIIIFIVVITGILSDLLLQSLLAIFSFILLRFFSGGYHVKSSLFCSVISSLILISIPYIQIDNQYLLALTVFTFVIILLFAPSQMEDNVTLAKKYYLKFKMISLLIVSSNFLLQSELLAITFLIQCFLVIFHPDIISKIKGLIIRKGGD